MIQSRRLRGTPLPFLLIHITYFLLHQNNLRILDAQMAMWCLCRSSGWRAKEVALCLLLCLGVAIGWNGGISMALLGSGWTCQWLREEPGSILPLHPISVRKHDSWNQIKKTRCACCSSIEERGQQKGTDNFWPLTTPFGIGNWSVRWHFRVFSKESTRVLENLRGGPQCPWGSRCYLGYCRLCPRTGRDISGHCPSELSLTHLTRDNCLVASQDCWLIGTWKGNGHRCFLPLELLFRWEGFSLFMVRLLPRHSGVSFLDPLGGRHGLCS